MSCSRLSCDQKFLTITVYYFFFQSREAVALGCLESSFKVFQILSGRVLQVFLLYHWAPDLKLDFLAF